MRDGAVVPRCKKIADVGAFTGDGRGIFFEQGALTTTAVIARRSGVSEGVLFQRFKTEELLLEATLTHDPGK